MKTGFDALAYWLIDYYLAATVTLAVVLIAQRFITQPARRLALQWGTLVGLAVLALLCALPAWPRIEVIDVARAVPDAVLQSSTKPLPPHSGSTNSLETKAAATAGVSAAGQWAHWVSEVDLGPARLVALAIFGIGCVLTGFRVLHGVMVARHVRRSASQAPPNVVAELESLVGAERCPELLVSDSHPVPIVTGTLWPKILLPPQFAERERPSDCRSVLAHELAHIQNGDLWLLALDRWLLPLFWMHPLYLRMRHTIRDDQELLADAFAASHSTRTDYADMLVRWARRLVAEKRTRPILGAVGVWDRPTRLADRITRLLQHNQPELSCPRRFRLGSLLSLVALPVMLSTATVRPETLPSRFGLVSISQSQTNSGCCCHSIRRTYGQVVPHKCVSVPRQQARAKGVGSPVIEPVSERRRT